MISLILGSAMTHPPIVIMSSFGQTIPTSIYLCASSLYFISFSRLTKNLRCLLWYCNKLFWSKYVKRLSVIGKALIIAPIISPFLCFQHIFQLDSLLCSCIGLPPEQWTLFFFFQAADDGPTQKSSFVKLGQELKASLESLEIAIDDWRFWSCCHLRRSSVFSRSSTAFSSSVSMPESLKIWLQDFADFFFLTNLWGAFGVEGGTNKGKESVSASSPVFGGWE